MHSQLHAFIQLLHYLQSQYKYHKRWHLYENITSRDIYTWNAFHNFAMRPVNAKTILRPPLHIKPAWHSSIHSMHAFTQLCSTYNPNINITKRWHLHWKYHQSWQRHMQCISQFCNEPVNAKTILRPGYTYLADGPTHAFRAAWPSPS